MGIGQDGVRRPIEPSSTAKADLYKKTYDAAIAPKGPCLGSYAFTWGWKQEATATWFGLLLPDGSKLGAVDALSQLWTGRPPRDLCPRIESLKVAGPAEVEPGATVRAELSAADPEGSPVKVTWRFVREATDLRTGGDAESAPPEFPDVLVRSDSQTATLTMPKDGGGYRLFAYVRDGKNGAAVANVPLFVKGPSSPVPARVATLPVIVYDEADGPAPPYSPSGFMGNTKAIQLDPTCADMPHSGKTCLKVRYTASSDWGGVVWQSPADDWGDRPGGLDLSGAKTLGFWAEAPRAARSSTSSSACSGRKNTPTPARGSSKK